MKHTFCLLGLFLLVATSACTRAVISSSHYQRQYDSSLYANRQKIQKPSTASSKREIEKILKKGRIRGSRVNIRSGPGINYSVVARLNDGARLILTDESKNGWCEVLVIDSRTYGWVWRAYVTVKSGNPKTLKYKGECLIKMADRRYVSPDGRRYVLTRRKEKSRNQSVPDSRPGFIPPLKRYAVTSPFGYRSRHPAGGPPGPHKGVDLKAPVDTPVLAVAAGVVTSVTRGWRGYGRYIDVRHKDGFMSRYAHLKRALVREGERVAQGDIIAFSGNTGRTTGPHLHFELRRYEKAVDPSDYIK